ncbi:hypothetical protein NKH95_27615 [Mesorhizobium sp. M0848]|uniref:hypothetical protein n=1 Tax=Mesorhizobium sp. M0848 TaxID=2957012 RepID=UPI003337195A
MRGSLAVWCEVNDIAVDGHPPSLELHFNMWRDLPSSVDVLDVGFRLKDWRTIKKFFFLIPSRVEKDQIKDLSRALKNDLTLSAVFNDTLAVGKDTGYSFHAIKDSSNVLLFEVIYLSVFEDIEFLYVEESDGTVNTILAFSENFFKKFKSSMGDCYIRFRLELSKSLRQLFSSAYYPLDRVFHTAFYRTDVVEIRVNERRNFGAALRKAYPDMTTPTISAVHYVLICEIGTELVRAHADFHRMRRLEPRLWDHYLERLERIDPEKMVIYHWRKSIKTDGVIEDFIALATFRRNFLNPKWLVLLLLVTVGALGSGIQALSASIARRYLPADFSEAPVQAMALTALSLVLLVLFGAFWCLRPRSDQTAAPSVWDRIKALAKKVVP